MLMVVDGSGGRGVVALVVDGGGVVALVVDGGGEVALVARGGGDGGEVELDTGGGADRSEEHTLNSSHRIASRMPSSA